MPVLSVNAQPYYYEIAGEGFPLLLASGLGETISAWEPLVPLLGEICRVIACEYRGSDVPQQAVEQCRSTFPGPDLAALLDALEVERLYLAADPTAAATALHFALQAPTRLEGVVLLGGFEDEAALAAPARRTGERREEVDTVALADRLHAMTVPTLLLVGDQSPQHLRQSERLAAHLPHCSRVVIAEAGAVPHREQPRRCGHAMMHFLIHCERQRHLVRGASLLL